MKIILNKIKMKNYSKASIVFAILLSVSSLELYAQNWWGMAVIENGKEKPAIMEYQSFAETAENGMMYHRIFDYSFRFRKEEYNPVQLQYGYRWADKQLFIYDFDNQKETLGFDFNLSAGNHFTTFNGMEWEVEATKDTLVNISLCGKGESVSKRLLTVRTLDGKLSDQWLEDFGSFINHFMINSLQNVKCSQTLWMEYGEGEYLAREIRTDPIYAHDSGWMDGHYGNSEKDSYTKCTFENGQVVFESVQWWWEHRDYTCFYRDGDDIHQVYCWELAPHVDGGTSALRKDVITFEGLPTPVTGNYTIHIGDNKYTTNISDVSASSLPTGCFYDMQGRRLWSQPTKGVYIKNGRKVLIK